MSARGLLVVLEGGEGVGKTTQWQKLADRITHAGQHVLALREPGGTPSGDVIRELLLNPRHSLTPTAEALLFAASRAELVERSLKPALDGGTVVLLDRYLLSTYVYQGMARGLNMDGLRRINAFATAGLVPDLTLLLSLPLNEAMARTVARGAPDRLEQEDRDFHERVQKGFQTATGNAWQAEYPECGPIVSVLAEGTPDEVSERCMQVLSARWPDRFGATVSLP